MNLFTNTVRVTIKAGYDANSGDPPAIDTITNVGYRIASAGSATRRVTRHRARTHN